MGAGEGFPGELLELVPVLGLLQLQAQCLPGGFVEYDLAVGMLQEQAQCFHAGLVEWDLVLALLQEEAGVLPGEADGIGLGCLSPAGASLWITCRAGRMSHNSCSSAGAGSYSL